MPAILGAPMAELPDPSALWHGTHVWKTSRPRVAASVSPKRHPERLSPPIKIRSGQNPKRRGTSVCTVRMFNREGVRESWMLTADKNEKQEEPAFRTRFTFDERNQRRPTNKTLLVTNVTTVLLRHNRHALQPLAQPIVFLANFLRQAIAEFLEEFSHVGVLLGPVGWLDAQQFVHRFARHVNAVQRDRIRRGHRSNRRFRRGGFSFDSLEHPFQDTRVFAVAGPQEFSV